MWLEHRIPTPKRLVVLRLNCSTFDEFKFLFGWFSSLFRLTYIRKGRLIAFEITLS